MEYTTHIENRNFTVMKYDQIIKFMEYVAVLYKISYFHSSDVQIDEICEAYYRGHKNS